MTQNKCRLDPRETRTGHPLASERHMAKPKENA